jgi:hypothetical protein
MFILDSLFMSGFRWVLNTVVSAAEAEMNDDAALRDQLLAAELRRETGEISDEDFAEIEADLLVRIREIKTRREGGSGPIAFGGQPLETSADTQFAIEATVSGDFHEPATDPVPFAPEPITAGDRSGTVIEGPLVDGTRGRRKGRTTRPLPSDDAVGERAAAPRSTTRKARRANEGTTPPADAPASGWTRQPTTRRAGRSTRRTDERLRSSRKIR